MTHSARQIHIVAHNELRARQLRDDGALNVVTGDRVVEVVALAQRGHVAGVLIDVELDDLLGAIRRLALYTDVHAICDEIDLHVLVPAFDAGLRGVVSRGDESARALDLAPFDPGLDAWCRKHAPDLIGTDPRLRETLDAIRACASTDATVLIHGENGSGKELIARALHAASQRPGPFVALDCAALPEQLVEAELFGHTRGAFTGATANRPASGLRLVRASSLPAAPRRAVEAAPTPMSAASLNLRDALEALERQLVDRARARSSGNRTEAATLLGLNRTTLVEKLRKLG
jgi:DNA-binding NtrC family response regulator